MRINKFVASATGLSRRAADSAIEQGRVLVNSQEPSAGYDVNTDDVVTLDGRTITPSVKTTTIMLNKPVGYVCSRDGQGSKTIYELLPKEYQELKPVGRLDKDSSGLLLLTNDGQLAYELTHPKFNKTKIYEIRLNRVLNPEDLKIINNLGVMLDDGLSKFTVQQLETSDQELAGKKMLLPSSSLLVTMSEGRNRQIRRTFSALDYTVKKLHRTQFGNYKLNDLKTGGCQQIKNLT